MNRFLVVLLVGLLVAVVVSRIALARCRARLNTCAALEIR